MRDRPSRQLLVVPPRTMSWPYLLGATAGLSCAAVIAWSLAGARPTALGDAGPALADGADIAELPDDGPTAAGSHGSAAAVEIAADPVEAGRGWAAPDLLEPAPDGRPIATAGYDAEPASADPDLEPLPGGTHATRAADDRPLSRFSTPAGEADAGATAPWPPVPTGPSADRPVADTAPPLDATAEPAPLPPAPAAPLLQPAAADLVPATAGVTASSEATASAAADPSGQSPPALDAPLPATTPFDPGPVAPAPPARSAAPATHDPDAPVPVDMARAAPFAPQGSMPPGSPTTQPSAFAAAPPLGAPIGPGPQPGPDAPEAQSPQAAQRSLTAGQARPGPSQLDGVQTPQLTVEKRGPREVQVGRSCRYEIIVRNVGAAVAQDVVIHDRVPYGTTLVATSPPAGPAGDPTTGDLAWRVGQLPAGSQARVAIELMPTLEGEIGSLASVSFRADAGVRARVTKPALVVEAVPPQPVLVGGQMPLAITVSNPGTGTATGIVLEGVVPEGLTHPAGRELEFDVGQLAPGQSRSIDLELAATGPGVHRLQLVARADGAIEVVTPVRLEVTAPTLDLAAEIPARRYLQRPAPCVLSMHNAGTAPARDVELVAQLPPGLKFVRTNNAGYYDERSHRVLWNLEELPAAETGSVELVVMPVELGPQKIVAAARAAGGLADQALHTIEVEGLAALAFEVADSEDPIEVGGVTEYVVRVSNQGTKAASGVCLVATLLGDIEPIAAKGPVPHGVDNRAISFEPLARLAPAEEAVYRIRVRGRRPGDQRVQVQLTSDDQPAPITKEEVTRVYADR